MRELELLEANLKALAEQGRADIALQLLQKSFEQCETFHQAERFLSLLRGVSGSFGQERVFQRIYLQTLSRARRTAELLAWFETHAPSDGLHLYKAWALLQHNRHEEALELLKTYKLERILRPRLLEATYTIPDDFDPSAYLSNAWGIVRSEPPVQVRLRFSPEASERIREGEVLKPESLRRARLAGLELHEAPGPTFWAHSHRDPARWQPLREHLHQVAELAAAKAQAFGEQENGRLAGRLHDLGKYGELFQRRLEGKEKGLDHWSAGAHLALFEYRQPTVALAVQGHHIGLQSGAKESLKEMRLEHLARQHPLGLRLSETDLELLKSRLEADGLALPSAQAAAHKVQLAANAAQMLDTRMLFSALVDADFLDTEAHLRGPEARPVAPSLRAQEALERLEAHLAQLSSDPQIPPKTRELRQQVAEAAALASGLEERIFTLTAPTGLGKTLAMLRFALRRAVRDPRIRRIVVVLPYLSILDQTAKTYRELFQDFGPHYILEDHSLAYRPLSKELSDEQDWLERERRLLAENWEAPIILTTHVQLLESLHAHRPGPCRKLHNLAGSILLFDEVQTLPAHLAVPTLKTLSRLASQKYGSVVVFATATQPAFDTLHDRVKEAEPQGWQPVEMVPGPELFSSRRVDLEWWVKNPTPWPHLVTLLAAEEQVLAVLNLKRQAHTLFGEAQKHGLEGLFHLSTALCPAHRRAVLEEVQRRLKHGQPCRLVATQVVEAGVELDFPLGYRALGPLEAIAQTAGRVNRHGLRKGGRLVVFLPEEEAYPDRAYAQAAALTKAMLAEGPLALDPATFRRYYQSLYSLQAPSDPEIETFIKTQNYAELARRYRIIESVAVNVVVPYNQEARELMQEARSRGISAAWIQRARPYTVPYFLPKDGPPPFLETLFLRYGRAEAPDWFLCADPALYDARLGFTPQDGQTAGLVA